MIRALPGGGDYENRRIRGSHVGTGYACSVRRLIELIAVADSSIDSEAVYQLVLARKRCGVMLLQPRVAVVHARIDDLRRLRMALATSREGQVCCADREDFVYAEAESVPANL